MQLKVTTFWYFVLVVKETTEYSTESILDVIEYFQFIYSLLSLKVTILHAKHTI